MRDYGKVHTSFWTSANVRALSEDGRTLAFYLLTCPHGTIAGVFRLPDGYACEDLQWSVERVREGFMELFANGFANRCETTKWVWIAKHFEWNPPENPNQRKAAAKIANQIPGDCCWKSVFMRDCGEIIGICAGEKENPSETLPEGFLNQEQEQEQEQDSCAPPAASPKPSKSATGTRLRDDWQLPKAWGEWAVKQSGFSASQVREIGERFGDYWRSVPGAKGRKLDWEATWRNWVREECARVPRTVKGRPAADPFAGAI